MFIRRAEDFVPHRAFRPSLEWCGRNDEGAVMADDYRHSDRLEEFTGVGRFYSASYVTLTVAVTVTGPGSKDVLAPPASAVS